MIVNGHIKFKGPAGQTVVCAATPRNGWRTMKNARQYLKRAGLEVPA